MTDTRTTLDDLIAREHDDDPEFARIWNERTLHRKLADIFHRLRQSAGLTQRQLAERLGWQQPAVARMEAVASVGLPQPQRIAAHARACGLETTLAFVDPRTGGILAALPCLPDEQSAITAERLISASWASSGRVRAPLAFQGGDMAAPKAHVVEEDSG